MIFVTVGTHEQPFDRLIKAMDDLKAEGTLTEEVIIQTGYSTYEPNHCKWQKLFPYSQMIQLVNDARIVITHGGPSSFIMALQIGKLPIVVPRMHKYGEHVNDHQVNFCRQVSADKQNILLVEDVAALGEILSDYEALSAAHSSNHESNNASFNAQLKDIISDLLGTNI